MNTGKHLKSWPMKTAGTTGVISSTCGCYQTSPQTYLWPVMYGRWHVFLFDEFDGGGKTRELMYSALLSVCEANRRNKIGEAFVHTAIVIILSKNTALQAYPQNNLSSCLLLEQDANSHDLFAYAA